MPNYLTAGFDTGMNNLLWYLTSENNNSVCLIDPAYETEIKQLIEVNNLKVESALITHHHWDHTDAVAWLLKQNPNLPIYGPRHSPFELINHPLNEGDSVSVLNNQYHFNVITTPGHTLDHISYYDENKHFCFVGDTVFAGGVGKMFEGTPSQFLNSINKLKSLDDKTRLFFSHEYLQPNMLFMQKVEPSNTLAKQRLKKAEQDFDYRTSSTIGLEKQSNPFFRTNNTEIQLSCQNLESIKITTEAETFASLRRLRNK